MAGFNINRYTTITAMDKAVKRLETAKKDNANIDKGEVDKQIEKINKAKTKLLNNIKMLKEVYPERYSELAPTKSAENLLNMAQIGSLLNVGPIIDENVSLPGGSGATVLSVSSLFKGEDGKFQVAKLEKASLGVAAIGLLTQTPIGLGALSLVGKAATFLFGVSPLAAVGLGAFAAIKSLRLLKKLFSPMITSFKQKQEKKQAIKDLNSELGAIENDGNVFETQNPIYEAFLNRIDNAMTSLGVGAARIGLTSPTEQSYNASINPIIAAINASEKLSETEKEQLKNYIDSERNRLFPDYDNERENEEENEEEITPEKIEAYKHSLDNSIERFSTDLENYSSEKETSLSERLSKIQSSVENTKYLSEEEKKNYTNKLRELTDKLQEKISTSEQKKDNGESEGSESGDGSSGGSDDSGNSDGGDDSGSDGSKKEDEKKNAEIKKLETSIEAKLGFLEEDNTFDQDELDNVSELINKYEALGGKNVDKFKERLNALKAKLSERDGSEKEDKKPSGSVLDQLKNDKSEAIKNVGKSISGIIASAKKSLSQAKTENLNEIVESGNIRTSINNARAAINDPSIDPKKKGILENLINLMDDKIKNIANDLVSGKSKQIKGGEVERQLNATLNNTGLGF